MYVADRLASASILRLEQHRKGKLNSIINRFVITPKPPPPIAVFAAEFYPL